MALIQEPADGKRELFNTLKHVRPGKNFAPNFPLTGKLEVNGPNEHELYRKVKSCCVPTFKKTIGDPKDLFYDGPIMYTDIYWNFEKFLIRPNGVAVRRYHPHTPVHQVYEDFLAFTKQDN